MNASAEKPVSRFEEWVDSPRSRLDDQLSKRRGWVLGTGYILTLVSGVLLMLMRQIDAVLLQMRPPGARGGGLSFPVTIGDLTGRYSLSGPWTAGDPAVTADTVVPPATLIVQLLVLDVLYALCSTGVLLVCYAVAWRLVRWYRSPSSAYLDGARSLLLAIGLVMIVVRFVVDVLEVVALFVAHCWGWGPAQVFGPWLTLATLVTAGIVAVPLAVAGVTILTGNGKLRASLAASRGVLVVLGAAIGLLLVLPIGSEQIDDVVRAWTPVNAVAAAVATVLAAGVVVGAVRQLTTGTPENLDPDTGDSPNTRLLVLVVVVGLSGVDLVLGGLGWGLLVPAGLLFIIWLLSRHTPARPADHPKRHHKTGTTDTTDSKLGRRVARLLGAGVCLVVLWVLIRAAAFDLFVRAEPLRPGWASLVLGVAVVLAAAGAAILFWRRRNTERLVTRLRLRRTSYPRPSWVYVAIRPWVVLTALAAGALWITWLLPWQWFAVGGPMGVGTLAVMMTGVAAAAGGAGLLVLCVRKSSCTDYTLPTALRALGFKRFPAVALILVWALIVAMFDPAGFHNARRRQVMPFTAPPSLEQAYDAWLAAGPAVSAHPLVLVAAEGGGIRAAVWTALVMECVFGPGPVKVTGSDPTKTVDPVCAEGSSFDAKAAGDEVRANRLPVFLASGASGGSVGLAAWSARRVDLAENEEGVPTDIDDLLKSDYVASDLGRLLTGDTLHQLLAQPGPDDRAGILERSWESSWGGTSGGLSRGLRASWQTANGQAHQWRIPVLAFNSSQVADGCRFVSSPVDFVVSRASTGSGAPVTGDDDHPDAATCQSAASTSPAVDALPKTSELIDYLCPDQDVNLSSASLLSARFPVVSPTGRIAAEDCHGDQNRRGLVKSTAVTTVIDGGYLDNSGASTALQAWQALEPGALAREQAGNGCVVPLFLQIDNSVERAAGDTSTSRPLEAAAPVQALLSQLGGRQSMASREAEHAFAAVRTVDGEAVTWTANGKPVATQDQESAWFRIAPAPQPGLQPPLGWTLSRSTVEDMRSQLRSPSNATTIVRLRTLLSSPMSCATEPAAPPTAAAPTR